MLFSPEISYFIATIYFIINLCFSINVILFLKIYKSKDTILSPKVKLNYNLCTAYLIMALLNIIPPIPLLVPRVYIPPIHLLSPRGIYSTYIYASYIQIFFSAYLNITIYFFYTFMFRIALVTDKTNIKTKCRFIFIWVLFIFNVILGAGNIIIRPSYLRLVLVDCAVVFVLLFYGEIKYLIKICREYNNIPTETEKEEEYKQKKYNRLVCFGIAQIITFICDIGFYALSSLVWTELSFIPGLINIVSHSIFLFCFIFDEDSYNEYKRIIQCKKKEAINPDQQMVSAIFINSNEEEYS